MIGNAYLFPLVVGCLEVGGRSSRTCRFAISSESVAPSGTFFRGGACWVGNANRQNPLLGGRLGPGMPGHLRYVHQTFSLPRETMHVIKLESGFDRS